MIGETLAQARDFTAELDALVLEGKRILVRKGMTAEDMQAFGLFSSAGKAGHGEAQLFLYQCYRSGWGVLENRSEAIEIGRAHV